MKHIRTLTLIFIAITVRWLVSLWGYSGQGMSPMFGDFEAQRHWLEITIALPIGDWYRHTKDNDLMYWGIDYPPLTAYTSFAIGKFAEYFYSPLVDLHSSRGHESLEGKIFMRLSVIICDTLILIPAVIWMYRAILYQKTNTLSLFSSTSNYIMILSILLNPSLILIDHGHFQYNGVCIGLALAGATAIINNYDLLGSIFFCLSLNFKQMSLYYALIFFCVLLRKCLIQVNISSKILKLVSIGITVIAVFAMLWLPFCIYHSADEGCMSSLLHVLSRQFPFSRGIFEDKVANIWFGLSVIYDFRKILVLSVLTKLSMALTITLMLPILYYLMTNSVTPVSFLLCLVNGSLVFFLASFQVHEKSLLLSLVPASFLLPFESLIFTWFQVLGTFTMFPLLIRDGLRLPYFVMIVLYCSLSQILYEYQKWKNLQVKSVPNEKEFQVIPRWLKLPFLKISYAGMLILHLMELFIKPPLRYPDLYPVLFSLYGLGNLLVMYLVTLYLLFTSKNKNMKIQ